MRITLVALDTRGGVQPYGALALGLRAAGHAVTVAASADSAALLTERGLDVVPIHQGDRSAAEGGRGVAEMSARDRNRFMRRQLLSSIAGSAEQVMTACAGADVVLGGVGGAVVGAPVAEKLGIPFAEAHLQPIGPPTGAFPGPLLPRVPRPLWPISHRLSAMALATPFAPAVKHLRTEVLGLPARARPVGGAGRAAVYGYSPRVVPPAPQWPPALRVSGYWVLPDDPAWTPPPALTDFLDGGPTPVAIGFGSMSSAEPEALTALVLDAARRVKVRVVLLSGAGALRDVGTEDVFVTAEVPHEWLYRRVAAVVHHGGAGTTAAGLRAGVPSVLVPFAVDQPFWASRVVALGVGPAPVARKHLTAERLAAALTRAVGDPGLRARAAGLGTVLRSEDGVGDDVRHLDAHWAQVGR